MANKKFSEFELKTSASDVSHLVGYNGLENVRISPNDLGLDSVSGSNSVYVKPVGTDVENGVALLSGLTDAIAKIQSETVEGQDIPIAFYDGFNGQFNGWTSHLYGPPTFGVTPEYGATITLDGTPTQVLITIISVGNIGELSFEFTMTDLSGTPIMQINGNPDFPAPDSTLLIPATLIIAKGNYSIASDFVLNNLVNVTSLTGQADVNITTSNVKIQSGANNAVTPISIVGLNLETSLYIESNLSHLTFKNCQALGSYSFSIEPGGTGTITGVFIDCVGGAFSFGSGSGIWAGGLFVGCKAQGSGFGKGGNTSGYFERCGGATASGSGSSGAVFGSEGDNVNGYFYYCVGQNGSFASENTGFTNAVFDYCMAGSQSFGYRNNNNRGTYQNCVGAGQCFGSNALNGDLAADARYYNCTAETIAIFSTVSSKFYNCHAKINWVNYIAADNGLAYNCSFGISDGTGGVTGTGKYRNCLDGAYNIVNLG